ncbi:Hypothetical_protein [Hexamita inflata]|uniref:Hypothetical_protein n=1 Tax=Hexamita inflata TaxID=28002 RepID=A0AA86RMV2_9EUKA|nr:Hypothetical protein HINF_LOCUS53505 [Hexamita inflata]CAI9974884.1 Hypothetical protein HINF_LOCUS62529 [Hexamita inflata]
MQPVSSERRKQISWNAISSGGCRTVNFFNYASSFTHLLYLCLIYLMEITRSDKQLKTLYQNYLYYTYFNRSHYIQVASVSTCEGTCVTRKQGCRVATIKDQTSIQLFKITPGQKGGGVPNVYA